MEEMDEIEMPELNIHHGRNIRRWRKRKGIKQIVLADLLHKSQAAISKYENTKEIDDDTLRHFANALEVPFESLKYMEENAEMVVFENITNNKYVGANDNISYGNNNDNYVNINNPIEKITELYERLLKEKDEKYAALEQRLRSVEESLQKK